MIKYEPQIGDVVSAKVLGDNMINHYRNSVISRVVAQNETHVVVEFLTYESGRVELWVKDHYEFSKTESLLEILKKLSCEDILKGALGEPWSGPCIGFEAGEFLLFAGSALEEGEVLARHESWNEFMKLVAEYSDFVPGDE